MQGNRERVRLWVILLLTAVTGILWSVTALFTGPEIVFREGVVASSSGNPIRALYVLPQFRNAPKARSLPAVVAIPPYTSRSKAMEIICAELARRGVACGIPDFFGKTEAESRQRMERDSFSVMTSDVLSIAEGMGRFLWVDPARIGVCGYSVGGKVAFLAGTRDPGIRAVVPIGVQTDVSPKVPQNLLFLVGLYDEFHSPLAMLQGFQEDGISSEPAYNVVYGAFDEGTARQISVIPTCDHFTETLDLMLVRHLLEWYSRVFEMPEINQGPLWVWWDRVLGFLFMVSASILYAHFATGLFMRIRDRRKAHLPAWVMARLPLIPLGILLLLIWVCGKSNPALGPLAADLIVGLLFAHSAACFVSGRQGQHSDHSRFGSLRPFGFLILSLYIAMLITWFIMGIPFYFRFPASLFWYPVFCVNVSILLPLKLWGKMVMWLFSDILTGLTPRAITICFFGSLLVFPDWFMRIINRIAEEAVHAVRSRSRAPRASQNGEYAQGGRAKTTLQPGRKPLAISTRSALKIGVLIVFWGILAFLVYRRSAEGMMTGEALRAGGAIILRFAILPLLITWLIVRTRFFHRISRI